MAYTLTQHAEYVIAERGVRTEWIERVFNAPEQTEPDREDATLEHRLGTIAENGDRVLRVVVNVHVDPMQVVTVYFDRRLRGKL